MTKDKAFIFDLNGTMINDMQFHLEVWYQTLVNDLGARLSREEVKQQMYGKNQELLKRVFGGDRFTEDELNFLSISKERKYQQIYGPHLGLIDGLFDFLDESYSSGIKMAIGTAAIPINIDFVLGTLKLGHYFQAIVSADDVARSKPHPETYLRAAALLNVDPSSCIVFEDSPKGVEAALNAGMQAIVLTTTHAYEEFHAYDNIILYLDNYLSVQPSTFVGTKINSFSDLLLV
jgi:beta-phosphoglucomutase